MPTTQINGSLDAYAHESITVSTTPIGITSTLLKQQLGSSTQSRGAAEALLSVETNSVRYTTDGTAPSATVGHLLAAGDVLVVSGVGNLQRLRFRAAAADGAVKVTLFA